MADFMKGLMEALGASRKARWEAERKEAQEGYEKLIIVEDEDTADNQLIFDACSFLHSSFMLREQEADWQNGTRMRADVFEKYGHHILHAFLAALELNKENVAPLQRIFAKDMLAVFKTLNSPIEDSEKIAHLRETFFSKQAVESLQAKVDE